MPRRARREPLWPFLLIVGVVAVGLGVGNVVSGGRRADVPSAALDGAGVDEGRVPSPENRVRVEVLNGSGVPGVAAGATELLRTAGLDVVYFGNESSFGRDTSVVLDRTGKAGVPEVVSRTLGITSVRAEADTTRLVDITVLLGADWSADSVEVRGVGGQDVPEDGRPWWDPRRFLDRGR